MKRLSLISALLLTGCLTQIGPVNDASPLTMPSDAVLLEHADDWKKLFTDPHLVSLIEQALSNNTDLRTAILNVEQAEAMLKVARMAFLPSLGIGAEGSGSKQPSSKAQWSYNVPLSTQWEIDISGKLKHDEDAAKALLSESCEAARAARLQVIAAVAGHYYNLLMLDEQLKVTQQSILIARKTVDVMEAMKEVGEQDEAAINLARATYLNVSSQENTIRHQIEVTENALRLLLGSYPERIVRSSMAVVPVQIVHDKKYPINALAYRPDVKAAEYALAACDSQVNAAKAAFYPALSISASAGWTNLLGEIVNPGKILLNTVTSLTQPIFDKGQNSANLRVAEVRREQALLAFRQSLLQAGTELHESLNACKLSNERISLRTREISAAQKAYDGSIELMRHSSNTYLEVLAAQSALLQARLAYASDWMDYMQGCVNLYKALGGNTSSM